MPANTGSKSVTLYLSLDTIAKLDAFASATHRTKSLAAELLILHGIANYDIAAAAPKAVTKPRKATAANTRVKQPATPKAKRPTKAKAKKVTSATRKTTAPRKRRATTAATGGQQAA